jgi:putative membrane protein
VIRLSTSSLFAVLFAAVVAIAAKGATSTSLHHRLRFPFLFAQTAPTASTSAGAESSTALRPNETAFLQDATAGGRAATELARLAVSQASSSSLRDLAQQMLGDYTQINNALEGLARRKAVTLPLSPTGFSSDFRQLSARTGQNFDRAYVHTIGETSQRELRLFESAVANAKDADVRDLAGSLLPVLRDHVNKLIELQKAM